MVVSVNEDITLAASVAERVERPVPTEVELSNGVVLAVRRVPPFAFREAALSVPRPRVPVQFVEDVGREVENPNHPDYLAALSNWQNEQQNAVANVLFLLGSRFKSAPQGFPTPEDDDWVEELADVGIDVPVDTPRRRYLSWLRYRALESVEDIQTLSSGIMALSGVTEQEVADAARAFRSDAGR